jgi:hypothetical protein
VAAAADDGEAGAAGAVEEADGRGRLEELDCPVAGAVETWLGGVVREGEERETDFDVVGSGAGVVDGLDTVDVRDSVPGVSVVWGVPDGFTGSSTATPRGELDELAEELIAAFAKPTSSGPVGRVLDQPTVAPTMAATTAATAKARTESRGASGRP